jgi:hypothetical protein
MLEKLSNTTITVVNLLNSRAICMGNNATTSFDPTTPLSGNLSFGPSAVVPFSSWRLVTAVSKRERRQEKFVTLRAFV